MIFKPYKSRRLLSGDTPFGRFRIEVGDHDGPIFNAQGEQIGTLAMEMREPNKGQSPSSSLTMAQTIKGAVKSAEAILGVGIADEAKIRARLKICQGCDKFKGGRCAECGCYTRFKTRLAKEQCPLEKW